MLKKKQQPNQNPSSQTDELQAASRWLADFGHIDKDVFDWTPEDVAEEITRAMAPLKYLRTATLELEGLNADMVCGYLDLFSVHMEEIKKNLHRMAHKKGQIEEVA